MAAGTFAGGPIGDRFGRKPVIWFSILGASPFTLMLPYANLFWTGVLSVTIGLILASAFSAILVYAQDLLPGRVGMVAGLFFGFSFGLGGLGAAALGQIADWTSIDTVYRVCSFLPLIGLLTRSCRISNGRASGKQGSRLRSPRDSGIGQPKRWRIPRLAPARAGAARPSTRCLVCGYTRTGSDRAVPWCGSRYQNMHRWGAHTMDPSGWG